MRRRLLSLVTITLAAGCGDQPLNDEPLLGPVTSSISPRAPTGTATFAPSISSADGRNAAQGSSNGAAVANSMMYWNQETAALRAGVVERDEWFGANVGMGSFATGKNTTASFSYATAMGEGTTAVGYASVATGKNTTASGDLALAAGEGTTAQAFASLVIGQWNIAVGDPTMWMFDDAAFVIGNGTSDADRHNAFAVSKGGRVDVAGLLTVAGDGFFNDNLSIDEDLTLLDLASAGTNTLCADNAGIVIACASSLRYKEDVEDLSRGLATVLELHPRTFRWKSDSPGARREDLGFIAEEVAELDPLLVTHNKDGTVRGVKYRHMAALLAKGIQELSHIVDEQQVTIVRQERENRQLQARTAALESATQRLEMAIAGLQK